MAAQLNVTGVDHTTEMYVLQNVVEILKRGYKMFIRKDRGCPHLKQFKPI
jgi:hypothetical protein